MRTPSWAPKCPTCGCELEDCGFPLPQKGVGRCPEGYVMCEFEAEVDESSTFLDKDGNVDKKVGWKVSGHPQ